MDEVESVRITTVVDNEVWEMGLKSAWGLSFYVEAFSDSGKHTVLMDTSGSFPTFSSNASRIGLNLSEVEAVFISHWHRDHCGALGRVLPLVNRGVKVYVPPGDTSRLKEVGEAGGIPVVCRNPVEFTGGMMSTGRLPGRISEHSLLINVKGRGLVVLVGCSHPGVTWILSRARRVSGVDRIYAVIGGIHISSVGEGLKVGELLRSLDVKLVSPCHCTSSEAKRGIMKVVGGKYVENGSGRAISIS